MTIKGIDLNMKWNDYESTVLYLWNGDTLFRIAEGSGDNLFPEDEAEGYLDYWVTDWYSKDDGNGGQWMETELISDIDYTIQGVIDRISECDLWDDEWIVLDEVTGDALADRFETYWAARNELRYEIEKIKED